MKLKLEDFVKDQQDRSAEFGGNMAEQQCGDLQETVAALAAGIGEVGLDEHAEQHMEQAGSEVSDMDDGVDELADLPVSIIITNVHDSVYDDHHSRAEFEAAVREFQSSATVYYLRNFRRARVDYDSPLSAVQARIRLNETDICGSKIKCFFAQPVKVLDSTGPHLQPPEPEKQFLISPPASPPVGWEPINESEPVINYELLAALANLRPGETHELHPASDSQPGIVVHVCEDPEGYLDKMKPKIIQTRRPDISQ